MDRSRTPPGRYDAPRRLPAGPARQVALGVAALAVLVVAYLAFARSSAGSAAGSVISYRVVSAERVELRFQVRRPPGRGAVCVVRARAADGSEVGSADVVVPASPRGTVEVDHVLPTTRLATTGEVDRCVVRG